MKELSTPKKVQSALIFPTYRPFGHHWLAGTSPSSLLRLNLGFADILLVALRSRWVLLLLLSTHPKIADFPQVVLILAAKLSAIILGVQNAAAAVWFGSTARHGSSGSNKASGG